MSQQKLGQVIPLRSSFKPVLPEAKNPLEARMLQVLQDTEESQWSHASGYHLGFPLMDKAFDGLRPGLVFIAGAANTGKSALALNIALNLAERNQVYCLYFALDDPRDDIIPRAIATIERIPINSVQMPERYNETDLMSRRKAGYEALAERADRLYILDRNDGDSIEFIEEQIRETIALLAESESDRELCVFIDSFHDIRTQAAAHSSENQKYSYICKELKRIAVAYNMPLVCTAHLRKLNGTRRPTVDDVKDTVETAFDAKAILLCHNDVSSKPDRPSVFYEATSKPGQRLPVLEVHFAKNKYSSYKDRLFYLFVPEHSFIEECSADVCKHYKTLAFQV